MSLTKHIILVYGKTSFKKEVFFVQSLEVSKIIGFSMC